MTARRMTRLHCDRGAVAGWEAIPFGLLVFVVGALVVANAWGVVDAKMAASAAAREGARAMVEAQDLSAGLVRMNEVVRAAIDGHGHDGRQASITWQGEFERCAVVAVTVAVPVDAIAVPWIGGLDSLVARSTHAEIVDPLRSGVPGEATCVTG